MTSDEQRQGPDFEPSPEQAKLSPSAPGQRVRWRPFLGLAPAAVILPLAIIAAAILLATGPLGLAKKAAPAPATRAEPSLAADQPGSATARETVEVGAAPPSLKPISPALFQEWLEQAHSRVLQSRFEDAIALYQELTRQAPYDPQPEVGWAWALILDGLVDQALPHAQRAVELDPLDPGSMTVLARAYADGSDSARALGMAQNAVKLAPRSAQANAMLAAAYLLDGQAAAAIEPAEQALRSDPNSAEAHGIRGWLCAEVENDQVQAVAELERAARLQPQLWLRHHELGLLLLDVGDLEGAILSFKQALALRPKARTYTAIGDAYYQQGEDDRARGFLGQALSAGAQDARTLALLAAIEARGGSCSDAQVYWDQALAADPGHSLALQARRICQGETPAAITSAPADSVPTITPTAHLSPSLSLAGWIAFPRWDPERGAYDTYTAQPAGGARRLVAEAVHQPAYSPDGSWLAVNGERQDQEDLLVVRPDGSDLRAITKHVEDALPAWSPDGQALAFSSTQHGDRQSRVYLLEPVPAAGQRADGRPLQSGSTDLLGVYPALTADGQIVYSGCAYEDTSADCGLFLILAEGGPQTAQPITHDSRDTAPAVSGERVAFMSNQEGNWEVYVVNLDGTRLRRLTNDPAQDGLPAWSPDGRTLAFVSDRGGAWAVWAMRPDGSGLLKLFDLGGGGLGPNWTEERISWGP